MKITKRSIALTGRYCLALGSALALMPPLAAQEARWNELNAQVLVYLRQGKYVEGTPIAQEALRGAEGTFGPQHVNTATALNNLAQLYKHLGRYGDLDPPCHPNQAMGILA